MTDIFSRQYASAIQTILELLRVTETPCVAAPRSQSRSQSLRRTTNAYLYHASEQQARGTYSDTRENGHRKVNAPTLSLQTGYCCWPWIRVLRFPWRHGPVSVRNGCGSRKSSQKGSE